jgi:hypothetical protein
LREIIADRPALVADAERLADECAEQGSYHFSVWQNPSPVFLNFTTIEHADDRRAPEVVIGWAVAAGLGFDQHCFVARGHHIHAFFVGIFETIWSAAESGSR